VSPDRIAVLLGVALGAGALAGCGGDDGGAETKAATTAPVILDTKRVEHAIEDSIRTEREVEADVDCPSGVHQSKGLTFRCVATTSAGTTQFVVSQADGKGNVTYAAR
jgi:hypothetical protein